MKEILELKEAIKGLKEKAAKVDELSALSEKVKELEVGLGEATKKISDLEALSKNLENLNEKFNLLSSKFDEISTEINKSREELKEVVPTILEIKKISPSEIIFQREAIEKLSKDLSSTQASILERINSIESKLIKEEEVSKIVDEKIESKIGESIGKVEKIYEDLTEKSKKMEESNRQLIERIDSLASQLSERIAAVNTAYSNLKEGLEISENRFSSLKEELAELKKELILKGDVEKFIESSKEFLEKWKEIDERITSLEKKVRFGRGIGKEVLEKLENRVSSLEKSVSSKEVTNLATKIFDEKFAENSQKLKDELIESVSEKITSEILPIKKDFASLSWLSKKMEESEKFLERVRKSLSEFSSQKEKIEKLDKSFSSLDERLENLEKYIVTIKDEVVGKISTQLINTIDEKVKEKFGEEVSKLRRIAKDVSDKYEKILNVRKEFVERVNSLVGEVESRINEVNKNFFSFKESLEDELKKATLAIEERIPKLIDSKVKGSLRAETSRVNKVYLDLNKKYKRVSKSVDNLLDEVKRIATDLDEKIAQTNASFSAFKEELKKGIEVEIEKTKSKIGSELEKFEAKTEKELRARASEFLSFEHKRLLKEMKKSFQKRISRIEKRAIGLVKNLQTQFAGLIEEYEKRFDILRKEIKDVSSAKVNEAFKEVSTLFSSQKEEIEKLKKELSVLKSSLEKMEKRVGKMSEEAKYFRESLRKELDELVSEYEKRFDIIKKKLGM